MSDRFGLPVQATENEKRIDPRQFAKEVAEAHLAWTTPLRLAKAPSGECSRGWYCIHGREFYQGGCDCRIVAAIKVTNLSLITVEGDAEWVEKVIDNLKKMLGADIRSIDRVVSN